VHFKREKSQVLSPDSHVKSSRFTKCRRSQRALSMTTLYSACGLTKPSYWYSWKLVGRPWSYQYGVWSDE